MEDFRAFSNANSYGLRFVELAESSCKRLFVVLHNGLLKIIN